MAQRVSSMSNPQLVALIRNLTKKRIVYRLTNNGQEPPFASLLSAATSVASKRKIQIHNPEEIPDDEQAD